MSRKTSDPRNRFPNTASNYQKRIDAVFQLPLHQYVGVRDIQASEGKSRVFLKVEDNAINPASMLHGGVVYTLCDVAAYTALLSVLPSDREAVTNNISVSILRPVKYGADVVFTAEVVKLGKTLCFIYAKACVSDTIVASASITKSIISR